MCGVSALPVDVPLLEKYTGRSRTCETMGCVDNSFVDEIESLSLIATGYDISFQYALFFSPSPPHTRKHASHQYNLQSSE